MELGLVQIILRMLIAAALGGAIGIERQIRGKVAGMRTTMLICTGAALFMIVSKLTADRSGDTGRIAAQVVSGIGFLGAGAILHNRAGVTGLTTAATIFVVAAIGLAAGGGYWRPAVVATGVVIFVLFLLGKVEYYLNARRQTFHYSFNTPNAAELMHEINLVFKEHKLTMEDVELTKKDDTYKISFSITTTPQVSQAVLHRLMATGAVSRVSAPTGSLVRKEIDTFAQEN
ncbi:MAG: MgtC/SapB family protein [Acidobacteriota bacterium]